MSMTASLQSSKWEIYLAIGDAVLFFAAIPLLLAWQFHLEAMPEAFPGARTFSLLVLLSVYLLVLYISDLYDRYKDYRELENISRVIFAVWLSMLLGWLIIRFSYDLYLSRNFIEWHALTFSFLLLAWRYSFSALALPKRLKRRVLIIGAGEAGQKLVRLVNSRSNSGLEVCGYVDDDPTKQGLVMAGVPVLGSCDDILALTQQHKIDIVVVALARQQYPRLLRTLGFLAFNHCYLVDIPTMYELLARKIPLEYISDSWLYLHGIYQSKLYYRHLKRIMDLALAVFGLLLLLPFFPIIALAIKMDSEGPVFFRQKRLGQAGKTFEIIKFRTMRVTADNERPRWTSGSNDDRITSVGRFLRKFRLDEVPQLLNVLKGDMSIIGPRAEWDVFALESQAEEVQYRPGRRASDPPGLLIPVGRQERIPYYSFRFVVKPGITGWAQVMFPMATSSPEDLKEKLAYDLYYIKNLGIILEIAILLRTIRVVLVGRGK
jgi:exopolysaccharide biosynthesis polyprenyl glycosylphosphotransferase